MQEQSKTGNQSQTDPNSTKEEQAEPNRSKNEPNRDNKATHRNRLLQGKQKSKPNWED